MLHERNNRTLIQHITFLTILLFALFRPLSLIGGNVFIGGLNTIQFFAIASSYVFLLLLLFNLRNFKFDTINLFIFIFCFYACLTINWGGDISKIARLVLPCVVFYTIRSTKLNSHSIKRILMWLIIGYSIPIIGSFMLIASGKISGHYVYGANLVKAHGLFLKSHTFGHSMAFFSFITGFFFLNFRKNSSKFFLIFLMVLLIISLFNLFVSHVRTAYLGAFIFWSIYLFFLNRRIFYFLYIILLLVILFYETELSKYLLLQAYNKNSADINEVSSGRISIWLHNISLWTKLPLEYKIAGIGFGGELKKLEYITGRFWSSHNDYLEILVQGGLFSLIGMLLIYLCLFIRLFFSFSTFNVKLFFASFLISVIIMNGVSNSYWHRPELSQLFWLMMGFMYHMSERTYEQI